MSKNLLEIWNELPEEVRYAIVVKQQGMATTSVYEEVLATVRKYPEYFPDETLYFTIPNEVHEAYRNEACGPTFGIIDFYPENVANEIVPPKEEYVRVSGTFTLKDVLAIFDDIEEYNKKIRATEKLKEDTWNKHYAPYGLKWGKNKHLIV